MVVTDDDYIMWMSAHAGTFDDERLQPFFLQPFFSWSCTQLAMWGDR